MDEINIEHGMPTVDVAMPLLTERLRSLCLTINRKVAGAGGDVWA